MTAANSASDENTNSSVDCVDRPEVEPEPEEGVGGLAVLLPLGALVNIGALVEDTREVGTGADVGRGDRRGYPLSHHPLTLNTRMEYRRE